MTGEGKVSFLVIVVAGFVLANTLSMTWIPLLLWLGILWILGITLWVWKKQVMLDLTLDTENRECDNKSIQDRGVR
ncbi:hypothetical protein O3V59_21635, partial [Brevibacillus thermoruber]